MYIRIYLFFRFYGQVSKWRSKRAIKYCEMEGCEANTEFAVKSVLKKSPLLALFSALIGSSVIFGTVLVNFENPMNEGQGGSGQDFTFIWNGMWLSVVTMTTGKKKKLFTNSGFWRLFCIESLWASCDRSHYFLGYFSDVTCGCSPHKLYGP